TGSAPRRWWRRSAPTCRDRPGARARGRRRRRERRAARVQDSTINLLAADRVGGGARLRSRTLSRTTSARWAPSAVSVAPFPRGGGTHATVGSARRRFSGAGQTEIEAFNKREEAISRDERPPADFDSDEFAAPHEATHGALADGPQDALSLVDGENSLFHPFPSR